MWSTDVRREVNGDIVEHEGVPKPNKIVVLIFWKEIKNNNF
jgi:hypothetical protein